ncbi:MAG: hypothetical protein H0Z29_03465 [Candidatus Marinimicrobia bacterium]|nr:hypothetical protein [Candidatus Neomarinimicrobiota bacterium]
MELKPKKYIYGTDIGYVKIGMSVNLIDNEYINLVKRAIKALEKQHEAISENISNVANPYYRRKNTDFRHILQTEEKLSKLHITRNKHVQGLPDEITESTLSIKKGDSEVDINREMSELAENQVRHDFVTRVLRGIYDKLNSSIKGKL